MITVVIIAMIAIIITTERENMLYHIGSRKNCILTFSSRD